MFSRQALLRSARAAAPQRAFLGQTRTFAAPASSEKVKPPVALFGLDGTYATALVRRPPPTDRLNWLLFFRDSGMDEVLRRLLHAFGRLINSEVDNGNQRTQLTCVILHWHETI